MLLWFLFCLARADPISVKVPTSATLDVRLHRTKLLFCLINSCFGSNFSWNCEGHKTNRFDFFLFSEFFRQKKYRALKKTCSWASHKFFRVAWSRVSQSRESHVRGKIYSSSSFVILSFVTCGMNKFLNECSLKLVKSSSSESFDLLEESPLKQV